MVSKLRVHRITERIQQELSGLMIQEVQDPRLVGVFITGIKLDRELNFADIYVSALEGTQRAEEVLAGLEHASGFLRSELSHRINLRIFPRLRFHWDPTPERAERIESLIASLHNEPASPDKEGGADG